MTPNDVIKAAIAKGACSESGKASDWKSLAWLMFTPQGREFCEDRQFPSLEMWREMSPSLNDDLPVVIDRNIRADNPADLALVGTSLAEVTYSGTDRVHKLILMHGAKALVRTTGYAVVLIVTIGDGCSVQLETDETAKILR